MTTSLVFESNDFTLEEKRDHEIEQVALFPIRQLPQKISPGSKAQN